MARRLSRALIVALVLWSWFPVVTAGFYLATPVQPQLAGDATIAIDRHGEDDSRISGAHDSDFTDRRSLLGRIALADGSLMLYGYQIPRASDRVAMRVLRDGVRRTIVVRPRSINLLRTIVGGPLDVALWLVMTLLNAGAVTCAGMLALRRPGVLTNSLLLALFGGLVNDVSPFPMITGLADFLIVTLGYGFQWYCWWEFVRFATRFPDGTAAGARATALADRGSPRGAGRRVGDAAQ